MRRYRVLFVCIGNACRSQMAEAFANKYGPDVLIARSAGVAHCEMVSPVTERLMLEKDIDLSAAKPKGLDTTGTDFDLIINMSGTPLPDSMGAALREWKVDDPIWFTDERHRQVRDQIEIMVQGLILELRRRGRPEPRKTVAPSEPV